MIDPINHILIGSKISETKKLVKFDISVVTVQPGDFSKATHLLGKISLFVNFS